MLAKDIRAILGDAPDDSEWGWNLFWKSDKDNDDAEPVFSLDMIQQMDLSIWQLDEEGD